MQPRWYQTETIDSFFDYFAKNKTGNPLAALPTGTGKSIVIAGFCKKALNMFPQTRIIVATHSKELVKQNYEKMAKIWPRAPIGIFSAGLKSKETIEPIIFGGIDSMVNCAAKFGHRDLLLIDEAHLVSPKDGTRYQKFINELKLINPRLRVIGLTATAFRAGMGSIASATKGAIFTDICYNMCDIDGFNRLLAEGYLAPLIPRKTEIEVDLSNVGIASNGDYVEGELSRQVEKVTYKALLEMLRLASDRKHGLIFTSGVENTVKTAEMLNRMGLSAVAVHSNTKEFQMSDKQRDENIELFVSKKVKYIVNNNILTTGFDAPHIDLIVMLRATLSASLWCLDEKTEVLTKDGFKNKDAILTTDLVATVNPVTMVAEYLPITGKIERNLLAEENFISYTSPHMDWRVSDNHRMLVKNRYGRSRIKTNPIFCEAKILVNKNYTNLPVSGFGHKIDLPLSDAELRFIGFFMSDGSLDKTNKQITIYQSKRYPEIQEKIRECFLGCGFKLREYYSKRPPHFDIHRFQIAYGNWKHLEKWLSKDFSLFLMELSEKQFDVLIEAIYWGDGQKQPKNVNWTQRSLHISTGNKLFAERLQQTALLNGYRAILTKAHVYYVRLKKQQWNTVSLSKDGRNNVINEPYSNEKIWCVENANGTLFTRRNGKVVIVGNCQMLGRGTRPDAGKTNCLVLDFARNTVRLGPINDPVLPQPKVKKKGGAPIKICPVCETYNHTSVKYCCDCGQEFIFKIKIEQTAASVELMRGELPVYQEFAVQSVYYKQHKTKKGDNALKITYQSDINVFTEYLLLENKEFFGQEARRKWRERHQTGNAPPDTITDCMLFTKQLKTPTKIKVWINKKYPEIMKVFYHDA